MLHHNTPICHLNNFSDVISKHKLRPCQKLKNILVRIEGYVRKILKQMRHLSLICGKTKANLPSCDSLVFTVGSDVDEWKFFVSNVFNRFSWLTSGARLGSEGQLSEFIEGLGPGQLVGRQVLASPALGDIQLSMCDKRGNLEVEVIRARGLQCKPGSNTLPGK